MSWGLDFTAAKGQDSRVAPYGSFASANIFLQGSGML